MKKRLLNKIFLILILLIPSQIYAYKTSLKAILATTGVILGGSIGCHIALTLYSSIFGSIAKINWNWIHGPIIKKARSSLITGFIGISTGAFTLSYLFLKSTSFF